MAEKRTRRRFTAEFRVQAVRRVVEGGKAVLEVAAELGIGTGQLSTWRKEQLAAGSAEALARRRAEEAEAQQLRREVKRLEEENLILRKAAVSSPRGSQDEVCLRVGGAGEPCGGDAVPGDRRQHQRLLCLAACDPLRSAPRRGRKRVAWPDWPGICRPAPRLRRPAGPCRVASPGPPARTPADRPADARDGPVRTPGTAAGAAHHRQPPRKPVAPNRLERTFQATGPNQVWLADITCIPTDEGWLYLAAVKDMATREILGWSMADHLKTGLCVDALIMAIHRHRPPPGLIHHGDRGVQYAAEAYRTLLECHGIVQSMSRRGTCLDNAPMESFFAALKIEHVHHAHFRPRDEAKAALFDYIEVFYNR